MHHEPYGMLVQLTDYIRGLYPALHLADSKLKHPGRSPNKENCGLQSEKDDITGRHFNSLYIQCYM